MLNESRIKRPTKASNPPIPRANRSEITSKRAALGVDSRAPIGPRRGLLDLGGQPQQQIFAAIRSEELNTDREALGRHVQRERDGGIACHVPRNRERAYIGHPPSDVGGMLAQSELEESERRRGSGCRRSDEDIESSAPPSRGRPRKFVDPFTCEDQFDRRHTAAAFDEKPGPRI